jgi:hypothetical protein
MPAEDHVRTGGAPGFLDRFRLRSLDAGDPTGVELVHRSNRTVRGRGYATGGSSARAGKGFTHLGAEHVTANTTAVDTEFRRGRRQPGGRR